MYRIGRGLPRDYAEALKWYRKAAERGFAPAQRAAAWILATAPDAQLRDGTEAIRLARQAVANSTDTKSLDTLAAAYAEAGQFDKAVEE